MPHLIDDPSFQRLFHTGIVADITVPQDIHLFRGSSELLKHSNFPKDDIPARKPK